MKLQIIKRAAILGLLSVLSLSCEREKEPTEISAILYADSAWSGIIELIDASDTVDTACVQYE